MSIIHLSDIEIQEYLDSQANKEKVESHILGCEECAVLLAEYEYFYTELAVDEAPKLSIEFVSQTMHAVHKETIIAESNPVFYLYSIASIAGVFLLLKYYVGLNFEIFKFNLPTINNVFADWSILNIAAKYYQSSPSTVNVLLFAGMILLFFALVDSVLSRRNLSKISSFSF